MSNTLRTLDLNLHIVGSDDGGYTGHFSDIPNSAQSAGSIDDIKSTVEDTVSKHLGISKDAMSIIENISVDPDVALNKGNVAVKGITISYKVQF